MTLASKLKAARIDAGLTLRQLAEATGCATNTLWRAETGESRPLFSHVEAVAEATGWSLEDFVDE